MNSTALSALRGTAQSAAAANTAPVHEHRCLYTRDLRRKQKRWQDGFLKFHTFNKRVMVYDQPRNYIGDTHYKDSDTLYDGDELTLENGVLVQVAEPIATTETDLTPIFQKKPREAPERAAAPANARLPTPGVRSTGINASIAPRHRPLSQLLGTPKGPHGRAVLPRSPFEERQANLQHQDDWAASERAAKRRKVAEAGHVWDNVKDTRTPVPATRHKPVTEAAEVSGRIGQMTPLAKKAPSRYAPGEFIDLVSSIEEPQSDVTLPNTPPDIIRPIPKARKKVVVPQKAQLQPQPPSSPPISTTNRVTRVQEETEILEKAIEDAEEEEQPKKMKKLRLAAGARPKMLLFQAGPPPKKPDKPARNGSTERPVKQKTAPKKQPGIRKLENGLTPSSPSEAPESADAAVPDPDRTDQVPGRDKNAHQRAKQLRPCMDPNPQEATSAQARQGRIDTNKTTVNNQHIQPDEVRIGCPQEALPVNQPSPRQLRRIRSENDKSVRNGPPGAPSDESGRVVPGKSRGPSINRGAPRQIQRSISLNVTMQNAQQREDTPPSPVVDTDVGPWSTEAMDLFDWRPPGYVFLGQGKGFGPAEGEGSTPGANP